MMKPGQITNFTVNFNAIDIYTTIYQILAQFKTEGINSFELEIYGFTCKRDKKSLYFANKIGEWSPESLDMERLENFFVIMKEHDNKELFFNVFFYPPYKARSNA